MQKARDPEENWVVYFTKAWIWFSSLIYLSNYICFSHVVSSHTDLPVESSKPQFSLENTHPTKTGRRRSGRSELNQPESKKVRLNNCSENVEPSPSLGISDGSTNVDTTWVGRATFLKFYSRRDAIYSENLPNKGCCKKPWCLNFQLCNILSYSKIVCLSPTIHIQQLGLVRKKISNLKKWK